ncbi:hypothetical protein TNCV_1662171 [Trichonephila clavipes]|nr:hypothetical protein TNCV_1662171 [Trichonephila clavipes]
MNENFPNITIKTAGEYIKLFPKTEEEKRSLTHFLELDEEYQFYVTQPKENKPLKVVLKGLPRVSLPEDIQIDLEALGYTIISCSQLISKRKKLELPLFLILIAPKLSRACPSPTSFQEIPKSVIPSPQN